jgi:hypothetical protein
MLMLDVGTPAGGPPPPCPGSDDPEDPDDPDEEDPGVDDEPGPKAFPLTVQAVHRAAITSSFMARDATPARKFLV